MLKEVLKGSEHVYRVLRLNVEKILGILNVLKYDPLYSWAISPVRKKDYKRLKMTTFHPNQMLKMMDQMLLEQFKELKPN